MMGDLAAGSHAAARTHLTPQSTVLALSLPHRPQHTTQAVIENEFGEVGIDDALVNRRIETEEEIFEMNNGCICCTVRGDLIRILNKLFQRKSKFDAILIETTGMADPAPVAQTFFMDDVVKAYARLDAIVTVVDALHIVQHLDEAKPEGCENEAVEQVVFADRLLLNKCDLVPEEAALARVEARLRALNSQAEVVRCAIRESGVDLARVLGISGFSLARVLEMEPDFLGPDQEHQHDTSIANVGIVRRGWCDMAKMNAWLAVLLRDKGQDIYRMKGVLAIHGMPHKFVFQGVHMVFDGQPLESAPWALGAGELPENKMIFIGKNLDRAGLTAAFDACLVVAQQASAATAAAAGDGGGGGGGGDGGGGGGGSEEEGKK